MTEVLIAKDFSEEISYGQEALDFDFNGPCFDNEHYEVPFTFSFKRALKFQNVIIVEGIVLKKAKSFSINLCFGKNGGDVAFHLNPRFDQNYIARNSLLGGEWGEEEGHSIRKMPLERGEPFQLQIFITKMDFLVCIDGYHLFRFKHRTPYYMITTMEIFGDLELTNVILSSSGVYPVSEVKSKQVLPSGNLVVPFNVMLKKQDLSSKVMKFEISGKVKLLPHSFFINLQSGPQVYPHPFVIYHLSVRYSSEACIVQNTWGYSGSDWDIEERSPLPLCLAPGRNFKLIIAVTDRAILSNFGGVKIPVFEIRLPPSLINCLYIQGDVTLSNVAPM